MEKLHKYISILLIAGFLLPFLTQLCVVSHFKMHQHEIVETLCENRHDPDSDCNGFCYLNKKVTKGHSHPMPENSPGVAFTHTFLGLFWESSETESHFPKVYQATLLAKHDLPSDGVPGGVFRPPQPIG